jgi:hypothetical protein
MLFSEQASAAPPTVASCVLLLDPARALDDIDSAVADWVRERDSTPGALLLGVETYWSLCAAEAAHYRGSALPLQLRDWCGISLLVDDSARWSVKLLPATDRPRDWRYEWAG